MKCPKCGATLKIPEKLMGKQGKCPKCGELISIPLALEIDEATLIEEVKLNGNDNNDWKSMKDRKICPFCGEAILREAVICKFCKHKVYEASGMASQTAPIGWAKYILYLLSAVIPVVGIVLGIIYLMKQDRNSKLFGITCLMCIFVLPYLFVIILCFLALYMEQNSFSIFQITNTTQRIWYCVVVCEIVLFPLSFVALGYFRIKGKSWLFSIMTQVCVVAVSFLVVFLIIWGIVRPDRQNTSIDISTDNRKESMFDKRMPMNRQPVRSEVDRTTHIILHQSYGDMCVIGGLINGDWMGQGYILPYIEPNERYSLYNLVFSRGTFKGGNVAENDYGKYVPFDTIPDSDEALIGFDEAMTRKPQIPALLSDGKMRNNVAELVEKLLREKAGSQARFSINIEKVFEIDLDKDGINEIFIEATAPEGEDYTADYTYDPVLLYDVAILASSDLNEYQVFESSYTVCKEEADLCFYKMEGFEFQSFTDFNGDGILEVFIRTFYYEGGGLDIFEYRNGALTKVLTGGCGL